MCKRAPNHTSHDGVGGSCTRDALFINLPIKKRYTSMQKSIPKISAVDASNRDDIFGTIQHVKMAVEDTGAYKKLIEKEFADVDPVKRYTFKARGKECKNRRDARWYACDHPTKGTPIYRIYNTAYGSPDTDSGMDAFKEQEPIVMPQWMRDMLSGISKEHEVPDWNHVVMHRYVDGNDTIGFHHDKYMDIAPDSTIVSISFGASRDFVVKTRFAKNKYSVRDGDAILLPYDVNKQTKHSIVKTSKSIGVRYSITARTIDSYVDTKNGLLHHRHGLRKIPRRSP